MPLRALADAIHTLDILIKQSRQIEGRDDPPVGAKETLNRQIDETMAIALSSLEKVVKIQASGHLDEHVKKEDAQIAEDDA